MAEKKETFLFGLMTELDAKENLTEKEQGMLDELHKLLDLELLSESLSCPSINCPNCGYKLYR